MTAWQKYVLARADGKGSREAARIAGFSRGIPSPQAREMWRRAELMLQHGKHHFAGKAGELEQRARAAKQFEALLAIL